jgi:gliding motility-associated lipoprotein GldB
MKKYILLFTLAIVFISCDKKTKEEKAIEEIPISLKLHRFEQAFFEAKPAELAKVKAQYHDFFPVNTPDAVWIEKLQNPQWRELYGEVEKKYKDFSTESADIENVFKSIKYYFPTVQTPQVYTAIGEMDYLNKVIYAKDKLIIALELYLGKKHKFYAEFPEYIAQNFEQRQMMPDVVTSFANGILPVDQEKTFLADMIYYGKELYLKDKLLPSDYTDAEKIGYTDEQIKWSKENESYIWTYFIEKETLYSTSPKLKGQFIEMAPFSKFYLEIDNESPGRIGQWIGWQIVRSFMENNPKITLPELIKLPATQIFEQSKYKPAKA